MLYQNWACSAAVTLHPAWTRGSRPGGEFLLLFSSMEHGGPLTVTKLYFIEKSFCPSLVDVLMFTTSVQVQWIKKYFSVLHCERIPWLQLLVYIRLILNKVSFTTAIWITYILNQKSCFRFGNKIVFAAVINNKRPCFLIIPVISVSINMHAEGCIGQPSLISLYK